jgi:hypothetical protein
MGSGWKGRKQSEKEANSQRDRRVGERKGSKTSTEDGTEGEREERNPHSAQERWVERNRHLPAT